MAATPRKNSTAWIPNLTSNSCIFIFPVFPSIHRSSSSHISLSRVFLESLSAETDPQSIPGNTAFTHFSVSVVHCHVLDCADTHTENTHLHQTESSTLMCSAGSPPILTRCCWTSICQGLSRGQKETFRTRELAFADSEVHSSASDRQV